MTNILFVCTGNTCRSPMAEAMMKSKAGNEINVKSAGVFATNGSAASPQTIQVLTEKGISSNHKSSFLSQELINWATYILTMASGHKQAITTRFPEIADKVYTLKEFVSNNGMDTDISDPYGGSIDIYRETYDELEPLIDALLKKLSD